MYHLHAIESSREKQSANWREKERERGRGGCRRKKKSERIKWREKSHRVRLLMLFFLFLLALAFSILSIGIYPLFSRLLGLFCYFSLSLSLYSPDSADRNELSTKSLGLTRWFTCISFSLFYSLMHFRLLLSLSGCVFSALLFNSSAFTSAKYTFSRHFACPLSLVETFRATGCREEYAGRRHSDLINNESIAFTDFNGTRVSLEHQQQQHVQSTGSLEKL